MNNQANDRAPVERRVIRPGPGWKHLGGAVYEHRSGIRMHMFGLVKLPNGDYLKANQWPESNEAARMIQINGGNRRRGLMAWALMFFSQADIDMKKEHEFPDIKFCPFCGSESLNFVNRVPRCTKCRAVFYVKFSRYARRSPKRRQP